MKKAILTFIILFGSSFALFAQSLDEKISINFNDVKLIDAINDIEKSTSYNFYLDPSWTDLNTKKISGNYSNITVEGLLEKILDKTELNFIIIKKKIILTLNNKIHDELPTNYFTDAPAIDKTNELTDSEDPIFYQQYDSVANYNVTKKTSVIFIGKENKASTKKSFTVSGYIRNLGNNKPEANIYVKVLNRNISTSTDNNGRYVIQLPRGKNVIEIKSIIHKEFRKTLMVYDDGTFDIALNDKLNELDEVVIKNKGKRATETVISGLVSIDIEKIKNVPLILGERDILKVATTLPGIKTTGEGSAGFNVRGGKEDQNLILLDNAVLYNPQHFLGFFSAINPYTAKKADIYKGSIPASFGGRLSSVFDITTKNGNPEKFSGEGAIGPVTANLALSIPIEKNKSSIIFGGRATYSDWILKALDNEDLKNSQAGFYDGILKYNNAINKNNNLETTFYYSKDRFSINSDSLFSYSNRLAALKWNHAFNEKNKAALIFTNSQYKFNIDYDDVNDVNAFDFGYKLNESQLQLNFDYILNNKHHFTYGIASKLYNNSPGYQYTKKPEATLVNTDIAEEKALENGIYISDSYKFSDKFLIDIGLRYSFYASLGEANVNSYESGKPKSDATVIGTQYYKNNEVIKTYGGFEPRIAARYSFNEDFSIKASFDVTRQYIHLLSSNVTQSPTDTWKLSDANVTPQRAKQFSLGLFRNLSDDLYEISLEGYYKTSQNILDYKVGAQLLLNENVETELLQGEGKAYGIELLLKKNEGKLNGWIGYSYSRSLIKLNGDYNEEKVNNGNYFPSNFDKPHDFSAILNYRFTKRYSLSTNFLYQTGRPITYPVGTFYYGDAQYTLYSDRNAFRIPDYIRLDIGFNLEGNHKTKKLAHSFWNISIYNVLGRNNPYSIYFITDSNGKVKGYKTSIFSIPVPSITYNFKF